MAKVVTASFAYPDQAVSLGETLGAVGIDAVVVDAGPRAYQVEVDEADDERAGEALSELGYLTCAVAEGARLGDVGVFEGTPLPGEPPPEDLPEIVEKELDRLANASAAMAHSTPLDSEKNYFKAAQFGEETAINGDLVIAIDIPEAPWGYVSVDHGVRMTSEEEIHIDHLVYAVLKDRPWIDESQVVAYIQDKFGPAVDLLYKYAQGRIYIWKPNP